MARQRKKWDPNAKSWKAYVDYLDEYNKRTDWVLRDHPYPEYHQFPEDRRDIRDEIDDKFRKEFVMTALMGLTTRERLILTHRFGLEDGVPKSCDFLGEMFSVGRQRILQIEARALRKMRHPTRMKMLMEPEEYMIHQAKVAKENAEREAQYRIFEEEQRLKREASHLEWKAESEARRVKEAEEREQRYQERQKKAWERWAEVEKQKVEDQAVYQQMKAEVDEYDRIQALKEQKQKQIDDWPKVQALKAEIYKKEMEQKIQDHQQESRRPYAWCPRTKTKRYLD